MKPSFTHLLIRKFRVFSTCLLSFLMLMIPIAPLAAAANRETATRTENRKQKKQLILGERLEKALFVNPLVNPAAPPGPIITATLTDSFVDNNGSSRADPGSIVTYTATITNSGGTDATGVSFMDTISPYTTLLGGTVKVSPLAFADAYNATINTTLSVSAPGVVGNDTGTPSPTVAGITTPVCGDVTTPFVCTTAQGGTVSLSADGSFTYDPPTGFTGSDSFVYTAANGQLPNATATVTITVTVANNAPVVTAGGTLNYTENGAAAVIDNTVTVTDSDSANLTGATVQITGNYASTEDVLSFVNQLGITGSYNSANGTMTLSGTTTVANYQTALRAVRYNNTSDNPSTAARTVTWIATDGITPSTGATSTINVTAVNDAPVVTAGATLSYNENDPAAVVDNTITVNDVDSTNLTGATVQITGNYQSAEDVLSFVNQLGITGSYNSGNGTLTLSGTTTVANYQTALRAVKYNNTSENPTTTARTVTWIVDDGAAANNLSTAVTSTINVASVNDAPVVTAGSTLSYTENDAATVIDSTVTVTDVDSTNLTGATVQITGNYASTEDVLSFVNQLGITGSYNSTNGKLTLSGTTTLANYQTALRAVKYNNTSDNPSTTARTVTWIVNDGAAANNLSTGVTSTINVTAVNDAPVLAAVEGSALAYTENAAATAVSSAITVTDVDSANLTGATVQITGNYQSAEDVLSFVNQLGITGSYNSTNGTMTLSGATTVANYQTALRAVKYHNTSDNPSTLTRTVTFQVDDGSALNNLSNTPTRNITVTAVNDAPVLANIEAAAVSYNENDVATAVSSTITVTDADSTNLTGATVQITGNYASAEDVLSFVNQLGITGSYNSANGTMTLSGSTTVANYQTALRAVKYNNTSDNPSTLSRTVTFQANDGAGVNNLSNTQTRNINVASVNDAPVLANVEGAALAYTENAAPAAVTSTITVTDSDNTNLTGATVQITGNYASAEDVLSFTNQLGITGSYNSTNGTMTLSGTTTLANYQTALRAVKYNNSSDNPSTLARTVTFQVNDGSALNNLSNTPTRNINVTAVNDAPIVTAGATLSYTENDPATVIDNTVTVNDPDNANMTGATVQITGNYQSAEDVLSFVNQLGITGSYNSVNGTMTLSGTTTVANYQTALRAVKYSNTSESPSTLARTVTWIVTDGITPSTGVTSTINVTSVNDAPVLAAIEGTALAYTENDAATAVTASITVSDVDSANMTGATVQITGNYQSTQDVLSFVNQLGITGSYNATNGTMTLTGTTTKANYQTALRAVKYNNTSDDPSTLARTVTFQVDDGQAQNHASNTQTRNINITAVNDAPTANGFAAQPAQAGIPITYPAAKLGGTDLEAGTTITIDTTPINVTNGTVAINANGSFTFTPLPGSVGVNTASFQYRVYDNGNPSGGPSPTGGLFSSYVTVSFTVAGPAIYFVKNPAVGLANCTLGNECLLATAVTAISATTNTRIFLEDANSHVGAVPLNNSGWLIGQGVTGTTFDTFFGINPTPAQGALAPRPALGLTRPTAQNTVTLNTNSVVRGLNIASTTTTGMTDPGAAISGVTVSELAVTTTTGTGISLSDTTSSSFTFTGLTTTGGGAGASLTGTNTSSTFNFSTVSISATGGNVGLVATGGGTINVTGAGNLISTATGTALNVSNTTIGASGLTFQGISSNGATNGIILNTTGATAGLSVTGNAGTCTSVPTCTGGTIQSATVGVSLNNTTSVSIDRMFISNTQNSGINGTLVNNFSFTNGKIDNSGTASGTGDSNIAFNKGAYAPTIGNEKNLTGTVTITGNTLTNAFYHGVDIYQFDGTVSNFNISNNTITSSTSTATSKGDGIRIVGFGSGATVASYSKGTINQNGITNFPSDAGIFFAGGNSTSTGAPAGTYGSDTSTNAISVTNNTIAGQSVANRMGTQGIFTSLNGRGTGVFVITGNSITNILGIGIATGANGNTTYTGIILGNTINAHNINNSAGIGGGTSNTFAATDTPTYNAKIGDGTVGGTNNISNTFGNGILINSINGTGHTNVRILKNTVAVPIESPPSGTTYGIRVAEGNISSSGDSICLDISQNTTAGNNDGAGTTAPGIGLRKQGAAQVFGIVGMAATSSPGVENFVNGQNPGSASGTFGTGGTALISATTGFSNCSEPAILAQLSPEMTNRHEYLARAASDDLFGSTRDTAARHAQSTKRAPRTGKQHTAATSVASASLTPMAGSSDVGPASSEAVARLNDTSNSGPTAIMSNGDPAAELRTPTAEQLKTAKAQPMRPASQTGASHASNKSGRERAFANHVVSRSAKLRTVADKPLTPASGETVNVNIGTLPAGKSVTITFQVQLNASMPAGTSQVTTQGTVTYSGGGAITNPDEGTPGLAPTASILTDDPGVGTNAPGETDPTVTPIDAPTATGSNVGGQLLDSNGNPVEGAAVRMSGTQNRLTVTDANGNYHFDDVETNGFYTVIPARSNFTFSPSQRAFSQLGQHTDAVFVANSTGTSLNPLDTTEYFVRQQYVDFLSREPDEAGFNFWYRNIEVCGADQACRAFKRSETSAAFLLSVEFQQTGYLVYKVYQSAYGDMPGAPVPLTRSEFKPDTEAIGHGLIVNQTGWETVLENNKQAFTAEFVTRSRFTTAYPTTMSPAELVDKLFLNAGVTPSDSERTAAIEEFNSAADTSNAGARSKALRRVAENPTLNQQEFNSAFVLMQYFGYLKRSPNEVPEVNQNYDGYSFWLEKLDHFNGNFRKAEMVKSFLVSGEYRERFPR